MKKMSLILFAFVTFAFGGIFTHLYYRTDDLSLRYNLWKVGLYSYQPEIILPALYVDRNRSSLIEGKTIEQILKIFPDAHEKPLRKEQYKLFKKEDETILWIGDSMHYISMKNGLGVYLAYEKHAG